MVNGVWGTLSLMMAMMSSIWGITTRPFCTLIVNQMPTWHVWELLSNRNHQLSCGLYSGLILLFSLCSLICVVHFADVLKHVSVGLTEWLVGSHHGMYWNLQILEYQGPYILLKMNISHTNIMLPYIICRSRCCFLFVLIVCMFWQGHFAFWK